MACAARRRAGIGHRLALEAQRDFELLGHGYGGTIISKVAEAMSERVRRRAYCNAIVPNDGESPDDNVPPHHRTLFARMASAGCATVASLPDDTSGRSRS